MPTPVRAILAIALITLLAACSNASGPYLKIVGGGFIFNYRLANAMAGILFIAERELPDGATVEVVFENPAGGAPLVQSEKVRAGEHQYDFRFEGLSGIKADVNYVATVRLLDADGNELERIEKAFRSQIDQAEIMPDKPLTIGPGYTPNPEAAH